MRLFPALLATVIASFLAAILFFSPELFVLFSKSAVSAIFSISNFFFWMQSGYFDSDSIYKPLLHTWSLSVEEQFYAFWPLVLFLIAGRHSGWGTIVWIAALSIASFGLTLVVQFGGFLPFDRWSLLFYAPVFRIFEFGLGALAVFLLPVVARITGILANLIFVAGVALLLTSVILFSEATPSATYFTLMPTIGAAAIILSGSSGLAQLLLANRPMILLGRVSYSIYLVHWPIIVFWSYSVGFGRADKVAILVLTVVLGAMLYALVETRFRIPRSLLGKGRSGKTGLGMMTFVLVVCGVATSVWMSNGWLWRYDPMVVALLDEKSLHAGPQVSNSYCFMERDDAPDAIDKNCYQSVQNGKSNIIIVGDSTAKALFPGLSDVIGDRANLLLWTSSLCPPLLGFEYAAIPFCDDSNDEFFNHVLKEQTYNLVILASVANQVMMDSYFPNTRAALEHADVPYVLMGPGLQFTGVPRSLVAKYGRLEGLDEYMQANLVSPCDQENGFDALVDPTHFLSLKQKFCPDGHPIWRKEQDIFFFDQIHLTGTGSVFAAEQIAVWLEKQNLM